MPRDVFLRGHQVPPTPGLDAGVSGQFPAKAGIDALRLFVFELREAAWSPQSGHRFSGARSNAAALRTVFALR